MNRHVAWKLEITTFGRLEQVKSQKGKTEIIVKS